MNFIKPLRHGEKGFTLIELLIVVAILGILAAVIIPNVSTFLKSGSVAAANTEEENVKTAELAYYSDNNSWPADSSALGPYLAGGVPSLKAVYSFDPDTGFITTGVLTGVTNPWSGVQWATGAGTPGSPTGSGSWTKN